MTALRRRAASIGTVAAVLALVGCAPFDDPTRGWDEPAHYTATVEYKAYDVDAGTYRITVRDHEVVAFAREDQRGAVVGEQLRVDPMNFTLRQIVGVYRAAAVDRHSEEIIYFDTQRVPTYVKIDWYPLQITDEQTWIISDVVVVN